MYYIVDNVTAKWDKSAQVKNDLKRHGCGKKYIPYIFLNQFNFSNWTLAAVQGVSLTTSCPIFDT